MIDSEKGDPCVVMVINRNIHRIACLGLIVLAMRSEALCHPFPTEALGRFTELTFHRNGFDVTYTLSLTPLLAVEEIALMNTNGDTQVTEEEKRAYFASLRTRLREGLRAELDGKPLEVEIAQNIELKPRYRILHYRCRFGPLSPGQHRVFFVDENYQTMPGPVEVTARADADLELLSDVNVDLSKQYQEQLASGSATGSLQVRELAIPFRIRDVGAAAAGGAAPSAPLKITEQKGAPETPPAGQNPSPQGAFQRLWGWSAEKMKELADRLFRGEIVGARETTLILLAFVLIGAAHALTPGHGKAVVAAYLIASQGRVSDAILLGGVVTVTHTFSVVILGIVVKILKDAVMPARLSPFLASASGLLILGMGTGMLIRRCYLAFRPPHEDAAHADHGHEGHPHSHAHSHSHALHGRTTLMGLLALGIAGGAVPCPDALVVLLMAVNFNHLLLGLALLFAFSAGLAAVLMGVGVLMVTGRMGLSGGAEESAMLRHYLPLGSAAVITLIGAVMTVAPLLNAGILTIRVTLPPP